MKIAMPHPSRCDQHIHDKGLHGKVKAHVNTYDTPRYNKALRLGSQSSWQHSITSLQSQLLHAQRALAISDPKLLSSCFLNIEAAQTWMLQGGCMWTTKFCGKAEVANSNEKTAQPQKLKKTSRQQPAPGPLCYQSTRGE